MLRHLFQYKGSNQAVNAQTLCRELSEGLQKGPDQVGASLQSVIRVLEGSKASSKCTESPPDIQINELVTQLLDADLPARMLTIILDLDFEVRKDVMRLFGALLNLGTQPVVAYVSSHSQILEMLLDGCSNEEVAMNSNMMLQSCAHNRQLAGSVLEAGLAMGLLNLTGHETFLISSSAFASLRELLLTHKDVAAEYLERRFSEFFDKFNALLQHGDYVTRRQALRLLGEILLDRSFMKVMLSYVSNEQYLQIHMNLLLEKSKALQIDAFHIFKVFAANPRKPQRVQQIIYKNKEGLIKLIKKISTKGDENSFKADQVAVLKALTNLEPPPVKRPASAGKYADGTPGVLVSASA